jgi:hypothetical protein
VATLTVRKKKRRKPRKNRVAKPNAPRRRTLTVKRAAKALAKMLFVHLVQIPENDRDERLAYMERQLAKRLEKWKGGKRKRSPEKQQAKRLPDRRKSARSRHG